MVALQNIELIDTETGEAFLELAKTADRFEQYDHPHAQRIAIIAEELAMMFHLARHDRGSLQAAALLHDLGEVAMEREYIPAARLLTNEERLDLARHPVIGEREASRVGADRAAQLLVRWHHEWWNGAGYPDALRREEIPLAARILRVADSYAALTDARPYRNAFSEEEARRVLADRAGIEFDPAVVNVLLSIEPLPEMASFAQVGEEEFTTETAPKQHRGWNLFSSFSK
jgi:HD-GYP domain-containing protein (c-di-GMP phosphodiesterase class II)